MDTTRTDYPSRVARVVTAAMVPDGWSEKALAEATAIPRATLRRRLAGSPFDVSELERIAAALGTDVTTLVAEAETLAVATDSGAA